MTATVCIPWRPSPARTPIFDRCVGFWKYHGFTVIEADSDPALPFLCNEARNNAVRRADTDVVVLADADTIPEHIEQISIATEHASATTQLTWPQTEIIHVDAKTSATTGIIDVGNRGTGLVVIARQAYWGIGGFDEGFVRGVGGLDDLAFTCAAETLLGSSRVEGVAYSFDHVDQNFQRGRTGGEASESHPNAGRFKFYQAAWCDPPRMRDLVDNRPPAGAVWAGDMPSPTRPAPVVLKWRRINNPGTVAS